MQAPCLQYLDELLPELAQARQSENPSEHAVVESSLVLDAQPTPPAASPAAAETRRARFLVMRAGRDPAEVMGQPAGQLVFAIRRDASDAPEEYRAVVPERVNEWLSAMTGAGVRVDECVGPGPRRPFLDIEMDLPEASRENVMKEIFALFRAVVGWECDREAADLVIRWAQASDEQKMSFHVLATDVRVDAETACRIVRLVIDNLPKALQAAVDATFARRKRPQLRTVLSAKNGKRPFVQEFPDEPHDLYLVQPEGATAEPAATEPVATVAADEISRVAAATMMIRPWLSAFHVRGNIINFIRRGAGYCPQCDRAHDHQGGFAYRQRGVWLYRCWAAQDKGTFGPTFERAFGTDELICAALQPAPAALPALPPLYDASVEIPFTGARVEVEQSERRADGSVRWFLRKLRPGCDHFLRAPRAGGKSVAMCEYVADERFVISISCRKSYTADTTRKMGEAPYLSFSAYNDEGLSAGPIDVEKVGRLVVQLESILRMTNWENLDFVLILDEAEGASEHLYGAKRKGAIAGLLTKLIRRAARVIVADAFLSDFEKDAVLKIRGERADEGLPPAPPAEVLDYTAPVGESRVTKWLASRKDLEGRIMLRVREQLAAPPEWRALNAFVVQAISRTWLEALAERLRAAGLSVAITTGDTGDEEKRGLFNDLGAGLGKVDCWLFNTAVSVGVSVAGDLGNRFREHFRYFEGGVVTCEQVAQLCARCRCATVCWTYARASYCGWQPTTIREAAQDALRSHNFPESLSAFITRVRDWENKECLLSSLYLGSHLRRCLSRRFFLSRLRWMLERDGERFEAVAPLENPESLGNLKQEGARAHGMLLEAVPVGSNEEMAALETKSTKTAEEKASVEKWRIARDFHLAPKDQTAEVLTKLTAPSALAAFQTAECLFDPSKLSRYVADNPIEVGVPDRVVCALDILEIAARTPVRTDGAVEPVSRAQFPKCEFDWAVTPKTEDDRDAILTKLGSVRARVRRITGSRPRDGEPTEPAQWLKTLNGLLHTLCRCSIAATSSHRQAFAFKHSWSPARPESADPRPSAAGRWPYALHGVKCPPERTLPEIPVSRRAEIEAFFAAI